MNYEKAYKEALERAKKVHDGELTISQDEVNDFNVYEYIFPELRESEDERIRKELLDHCINRRDGKPICVDASDYRRWAAWLEKQGEQKHKIQPKFKIGDIIRFKGNETLKGEVEAHKIVGYDNELYVFADGTTDLFSEQDLYELVEQKPSWSEEDEKMLNDIIMCGERHCYLDDGNIAWLKSLKDRVKPQLKQEWSEQDEDNIKCICSYLELYLNHATDINEIEECKYLKDWLKSIKPNRWKPSEEQMSMLLAVLNDSNNITAESVYIALKSLYNDLKKL